MMSLGTIAAVEGLIAAGVIVLAIIGLSGNIEGWAMTIGTLALGAAMLFQGGARAGRGYQVESGDVPFEEAALSAGDEGLNAESLSGVAGLTLGILALLAMATIPLCAVALIVFGAAELFESVLGSRYTLLGVSPGDPRQRIRVIPLGADVSASGRALVGAAAVTLGILALLAIAPVGLILVGLLVVASGILLGATATGVRVAGSARHVHAS